MPGWSRDLAGVAILGGLLAAAPVGASGQAPSWESPSDTHRPFAIAVVDDVGYPGADAVVVRRASASPHDVVLVREARANPRLLAAAVRHLAALRALQGDTPGVDGVYRVTLDARNDQRWVRPDEPAKWMRSLNRASEVPLEGFENAKYIVLEMPIQRGHR